MNCETEIEKIPFNLVQENEEVKDLSESSSDCDPTPQTKQSKMQREVESSVNDSSEEEDIVPLESEFDIDFKKSMDRFLRIKSIGMPKKN